MEVIDCIIVIIGIVIVASAVAGLIAYLIREIMGGYR